MRYRSLVGIAMRTDCQRQNRSDERRHHRLVVEQTAIMLDSAVRKTDVAITPAARFIRLADRTAALDRLLARASADASADANSLHNGRQGRVASAAKPRSDASDVTMPVVSRVIHWPPFRRRSARLLPLQCQAKPRARPVGRDGAALRHGRAVKQHCSMRTWS